MDGEQISGLLSKGWIHRICGMCVVLIKPGGQQHFTGLTGSRFLELGQELFLNFLRDYPERTSRPTQAIIGEIFVDLVLTQDVTQIAIGNDRFRDIPEYVEHFI